MREILFRGKRKDNGEWIYGGYAKCNNREYILPDIDLVSQEWVFRNIEVIPETVGRYTGLCDKNSTKIFEGDILLKGFEKVLVKWNSNQCRWGIYSNGYEISGFNESTKNYFEVIGNIYDNPEFLEGKE